MVSPKISCLITIERDDVELDVEVRGVYCRAERATFHEPGCGPSVEDVRAYSNGHEIKLSDEEEEMAADALLGGGDIDGPGGDW